MHDTAQVQFQMKGFADFSGFVAPLKSFAENVLRLEKLKIIRLDDSIRQELDAIANLRER